VSTSKPGVRGPSRTKRHDILAAAYRLFLQHGFAATTIEDVATEAGVSKQTVYAHFGDGDDPVKDTLFRAMVEREVGLRHLDAHPLEVTMALTHDLEDDLRTFARHHLHLVMRPDLIQLRRMLIGEAERFPGLANVWWTNGPVRSFELFAGWFTILDERGLLHVPDPLLAAQTFNWLVLSTPLNEAMALGAPTDATDLDRHADEAVRVFLAAYQPRTPR
jgi:TetR/AcrR family transcriptional regulator, mexJK operon transcriptional repressor